jgi:hypothetical protein
MLVGDAACFVDPVLSSGVHLAQYGAVLAARSINACLTGVVAEEDAFKEFEMRYKKEYAYFYKFLVSFYDMHRDSDSYFWVARSLLEREGGPDDQKTAFVRLVSGQGSLAEESGGPFRELAGAGEDLSKILRKEKSILTVSLEFMITHAVFKIQEYLRIPIFAGGGTITRWACLGATDIFEGGFAIGYFVRSFQYY